MITLTRYPLARPHRLSAEVVASRTGIHPDLLRRFVAMSLVEATRDSSGRLWFTESAPTTVARIQRLRFGLALNYAGIGLVMDLLDRIAQLEASARSTRPWT